MRPTLAFAVSAWGALSVGCATVGPRLVIQGHEFRDVRTSAVWSRASDDEIVLSLTLSHNDASTFDDDVRATVFVRIAPEDARVGQVISLTKESVPAVAVGSSARTCKEEFSRVEGELRVLSVSGSMIGVHIAVTAGGEGACLTDDILVSGTFDASRSGSSP